MSSEAGNHVLVSEGGNHLEPEPKHCAVAFSSSSILYRFSFNMMYSSSSLLLLNAARVLFSWHCAENNSKVHQS